MEKITRSFTLSLNRFHKRVESLLDAEDHRPDPEAAPFEASRDPAMVRGISMGLPEDHVDRAIVSFSRLAGLFQAGILLENHDGQWKPHAIFNEGIARPLRGDDLPFVKLPQVSPLTALKAPTDPLLAKLGLKELARAGRNTFLVKPVPDFAYLLLTDLPDLWLKDHLERTVNALADGFAG